MEEPPVAASEMSFSDSKPVEASEAIVKPCEGEDASANLSAALDVVDKAWTAIENGHAAEPATTLLDGKQAEEAVASSEADRSLSFTNGECCERLEIVETSSSPEEGQQRAMESECCPAEAQDAVAPNDNGMTAAASDSAAGEGTPVECGSPCLDNGTTDGDSAVPSDIISHAVEDAGSPCTNDGDPAELAEEEVDVRGMPLSENDAAESSATGECDTKTDDGLHNINLDLGNIRQRFESPQESVPSVADRSALGRSESLLQRLEKYQSVAAGERNGDAHSPAESEDEDSSVVRETKTKEKVVYEGLSSLKSQWESGAVSSHQERTEETKEELAKLRKKMCLGRSESMRQVYQKAVEDANRIQAGRAEQISVEGQEARATSIKEKFEAGVVTQETEAEKIERLQREKQEELSVFNETGIAHEAKNIFKQLDAEVARQSGAPSASLARSPSNRWNVARPQQNAVSPGDVVRSSDPVHDVEVATTEVSERFKFFENFKDDSNKQRKRFEMTPPRESGKEPSPEFQPPRDPNVVRAADPAEEVIVTDTARRMRERFRELEVNASREEPPQGPKPLKRITPPREYTRDNAHEPSPEVQRDPDIVQCSYRVEDDIVVEADRAKSMRARFENWDAEREARESRRNGENADEECLPMADTAKTLRAKFEAIRDESERQEAHRPKPKVNRFVEFPGTPNSEACAICNKKLYPMERMEVSGLRMHKNCFRCSHCSCHLRLESYTISGGKLYCGPHFKQFFIAKGNYDEGFGREKWSRSASPASRESNEEYTNGDRDHMGILDQPVIA
uniref:Transcription factor l2 n=1 Tax=Rhipicephalus zambeziensis TaxID=60191 RepID=A0A224ZAM7_9ACAR